MYIGRKLPFSSGSERMKARIRYCVKGYMLSLSEISIIKQTYLLSAESLGAALDTLMQRKDYGLKDDETCVRIIF
jgi:hypothetical protein